MKEPLKILFVEDVPADAEMIWHEISRSKIGFDKKLVDTKEDYIAALKSFAPDIIISDYSLPQFDGMTALLLKNDVAPLTPFILVTGSINEEIAVEIMKAGADDYVIKQNLSRLGPSIRAALSKAEIIIKKERAENEVKESEERFHLAVANSPVPIMIHDEDDKILLLSKGWIELSGYSVNDIPTMGDWTEKAYGERSGSEKDYIDNMFNINMTVDNGEWTIRTKDGKERIWEFHTTPLGRVNRGKRVLHCVAIDITEWKNAEKALKLKIDELEQFNDLTVDRELKMINLKKEVNDLLKQQGKSEKYKIIE